MIIWPQQISAASPPIFMSKIDDSGDWELPADFEVWNRPADDTDPYSRAFEAIAKEPQ